MATHLKQSSFPTPYIPPYHRRVLCHPIKIVALGDSLVYGFGDPERGGWVEQLRRWWMLPDSPGHVLYNLSVRGFGPNKWHSG